MTRYKPGDMPTKEELLLDPEVSVTTVGEVLADPEVQKKIEEGDRAQKLLCHSMTEREKLICENGMALHFSLYWDTPTQRAILAETKRLFVSYYHKTGRMRFAIATDPGIHEYHLRFVVPLLEDKNIDESWENPDLIPEDGSYHMPTDPGYQN